MMQANKNFPVLSTLSRIIFVVGALVLIVGVFSGALEAKELIKVIGKPSGTWSFDFKDYILMASFIVCVSGGLIAMAIAESIGVLFAIENNTRSKINL